MIQGFHHVAISTPDLERARDFYCGLLGFEQVMTMGYERSGTPRPHLQADDGAARGVVIRAGFVHLEIVEYSYPVPNPIDPRRQVVDHGLAHLSFQVTHLESEYARLCEAGMVFHSEPMQGIDEGSLFVYGRDPDGNVLEFIEFGPVATFPAVYSQAAPD
ncbi:VOC family protein [Parahaliea mediterranea]|uniref:VOC family protein n=1 Tax=Parahaliea mediterranea TaxID=651086 RepID=A0A939DGX3_9GAMM|nr:VOC family protein [Parahaliea mediterranea]MBN7797651.1 VOC family protein [Parahaliea mediterranea]